MRTIKLSDEEILLLDGKVNSDAQKIINNVKQIHLYDAIGDPLLAEIVKVAVEKCDLSYSWRPLASCSKCGKTALYPRYKSGSRKGQINFNKDRLLFSGVSFHDGFVRTHGYSTYGFCDVCGKEAIEKIITFILINDLPIDIHNDKGVYVRENERECFSCHAKIWEFDMRPRPAIMNGNYYAMCPKCGTEHIAFGSSHKPTGNHRAVKKDALRLIGNCWQRNQI